MSRRIESIAVFCGANAGSRAVFASATAELGSSIAGRNTRLVYGGGRVGLMGVLADTALENNGYVVGVIPRFLQTKEIAHPHLSETVLVDTMHERKVRMHELSDGVIALPGGFGTLDEFFEMVTWAQLGLHGKPLVLLNVDGYFSHLLTFVEAMVTEGFVRPEHRTMLLTADSPDAAFEMMESYIAPDSPKWIPVGGA